MGPRGRQGLGRPVEQQPRRARQGPARPGRQAVRRVEPLPHPPGRRADDGLPERQARRRPRHHGELLGPQAARSSPAGRSSSRPTAARSAGGTSSSARSRRTRRTRSCAATAADGFEPIFNGKDLDGWAGAVDNYEVVDGAIRCKPGRAASLYTTRSSPTSSPGSSSSCRPAATTAWRSATRGKGDAAYVGMCELQVLDDTADEVREARPPAVPRLGLRHGRGQARLPAAGRRVELPGSDRQGPEDQGRAERHRDPRRRPEQGHRVHGQQAAPRQGPHVRLSSASPATATRSSSATSRSSRWIDAPRVDSASTDRPARPGRTRPWSIAGTRIDRDYPRRGGSPACQLELGRTPPVNSHTPSAFADRTPNDVNRGTHRGICLLNLLLTT